MLAGKYVQKDYGCDRDTLCPTGTAADDVVLVQHGRVLWVPRGKCDTSERQECREYEYVYTKEAENASKIRGGKDCSRALHLKNFSGCDSPTVFVEVSCGACFDGRLQQALLRYR